MTLIAKDMMIKNVRTINEGSSVYEAIQILISLNENCLPVLNSRGILTGIVTETDLVYIDKKLNESSYYAYSYLYIPIDPNALERNVDRLKNHQIKDVMTRKLITVKENTPLEKIIDIIVNKAIKTIPVVKDSKLIGLITRKSILKYYVW